MSLYTICIQIFYFLAWVFASGFLYVASVCVYRVLFHPYAKYPGPLLAKVTNLYSAYHAWNGDIHIDMAKCHQKYGHYVRYAPDRLMFDTAEALQDIYNHRSNVTKGSSYEALVHRAPNTLTQRDKKLHGKKRRVISQGFSDNALRAFEGPITAQIQKFSGLLGGNKNDYSTEDDLFTEQSSENWSPVRDMARWCDYLAFDIMAAVTFSASYDTLGSIENRPVIKAIETSNVRMSVLLQAPGLPKFHQKLFPDAIAARNVFIKFVNRMLKERYARIEKNNKDIFSFLAEAKDPETGKGFDDNELGAESTTLVVAGSDTSSTAMAATLFYLSHYPTCYNTLAAEVRSAFSTAEEIRIGPNLNKCVYLRACIDETLRISPSASSALWREVLPGGITADAHFIPAGYDIGISIYALHHNPTYYPDPHRYMPERWLRVYGGAEPPVKAYFPFSIGPRGCVGKSLAMMELMLTIATVMWTYDFENVDGVVVGDEGGEKVLADEYQLKDHVTAAKDGPVLRFRLRQ